MHRLVLALLPPSAYRLLQVRPQQGLRVHPDEPIHRKAAQPVQPAVRPEAQLLLHARQPLCAGLCVRAAGILPAVQGLQALTHAAKAAGLISS